MPNTNTVTKLTTIGVSLAIALGLYLSSRYNYLLFHSFIEIITIAIAFAFFALIWNSRAYLENSSLRLLGIGYAFTALIDLIHTFAFKGMNIFPGFDANLPTQFWIAARYLQVVTLLAAPGFVERRVSNGTLFGVYAAAVSVLVAAIFSGNFPDCFIEGKGLTAFKINSEYVISFLLLSSLYLISKKRHYFNDTVFFLLASSIACTILSEIVFTAYVSVYGFANLVGHIAKLAAFYLIYRAIIVTGFKEPFDLIFRGLKQAEEALQKSHATLEEKVRERTAEVQENQRFLSEVIENSGAVIYAKDREGRYELINRKWEEATGLKRASSIGKTDEDLLPGPIGREFRKNDVQVMESGRTLEVEEQIRDAAGTKYFLSIKIPLRDNNNEVKGICGISTDITGRKEMEDALRESSQRLRVIVETAMDGFWLADTKGRLLEVNNTYCRMSGYSAQELLAMRIIDLSCEAPRENVAHMKTIIAQGEERFESRHRRKDGSSFDVEVSVQYRPVEGGLFWVFLRDITGRKRMEDELRNSKLFSDSIIEQSPISMWVSDDKGTLLRANQALRNLLHLSDEEIVGRYNLFADAQVEAQGFMPGIRAVFEKGTITRFTVNYDTADVRNLNLQKTIKTVLDVTISPIKNAEGKVTNAIIQHIDMTERKIAEDKLFNLIREQKIILDNAPIGISKIVDRIQVLVNQATLDLFQYPKEEMEGQTTQILYPSQEAYDQLGRDAYPVLSQGRSYEMVQKMIRRDGTPLQMRCVGRAIDPPDMTKGTIWILEDITERKQAEEQLRRSLEEKTVMLKEIHHRVKNNMQVISSLLNLQADEITDEAVRALFEESQNRIRSMALVHEKLYRSENLALIDFRDYLESLINDISNSFNRAGVAVSVEMEPVFLDVNIGIPCGLIVNELVSNSLKYAFPEGSKGTIKVGIAKDGNGNNVLTVADNGIGFPAHIDLRKTKTLGLRLVNILTGQIHGKLALAVDNGTKVSITFPERNPNL